MVVIALLTASSLFAVAALFSHDQVLADVVAVSPSASASPSPGGDVTQTPTPTPITTDTTTPTPTPTSTIDPAAVILDIANYKVKALKVERKAKKARIELAKRAKALCKQSPKRMLGSSFDTWQARWVYYKDRLHAILHQSRKYWKLIRHPKAKSGVNRWIPLLRYCGMPSHQMWHALKVMHGESRGNPCAKNKHSTASGLFQFLSSWWRNKTTGKKKWNPFDPYQNIQHFVWAVLGPSGWSPWALTA
jgi:hypothetical protein